MNSRQHHEIGILKNLTGSLYVQTTGSDTKYWFPLYSLYLLCLTSTVPPILLLVVTNLVAKLSFCGTCCPDCQKTILPCCCVWSRVASLWNDPEEPFILWHWSRRVDPTNHEWRKARSTFGDEETNRWRNAASRDMHNQLETIPNEIGYLTKLMVIALSFNHIRHIPASISNLYQLEQLYLSENRLGRFPDCENLLRLEVMNLSDIFSNKFHHKLAILSTCKRSFCKKTSSKHCQKSLINSSTCKA